MASKFTKVECAYTGGSIYVFTALYNNEVWFTTDFGAMGYGTYDVHPDRINEEFEGDYDGHWKDPSIPLPTWREILHAVDDHRGEPNCSNLDYDELVLWCREDHPDLDRHVNEDDPEIEEMDPNTYRLDTINCFIEIFEDFLEWKGIEIPNDEKEEDPESASNIYGTDYGFLQQRIEAYLIRLGVLEEEV